VTKRQFGAIRQLPSGRYQARYRHPGSNRMMSAPVTFKTKADAGRWLSSIESDLMRGSWKDPSVGQATLSEYSDAWLQQRILRPRTVELYRGLLDRYIVPALGDTDLSKLSVAAVRAWHSDLVKADRPGPVTVAKSYRLLRTICGTAVEDELILRNPCIVKGASVERSPERPVLSVSQLATLIEAMEDRYRAMIILGAWCGLRLGELLALTRRDVNLLHGTVGVNKSAAELKSGERIVGPPKTSAGVRVVSIPPHVIPVLEHHLATFSGPGIDGLIFVGTMGQPVRRGSLYTEWQRAQKKAGLEGFRFHDLRHTGATMAASTGASTREIMKRLGHSTSNAALRYQHATEERDAVIAKALSEMARENEGATHEEPCEEDSTREGLGQ
jgi:integrase